jgi:hypothetical protein
MATITTYRGEKNLTELSNKLFARLTPRQQEKVEAALLKANPQLQDIANLQSGTLLHVPSLPELRNKTRRVLENPDAQITARLLEDVGTYDTLLAARHETAQAQLAVTARLLSNKDMLKAMAGDPTLKQLIADIDKSNGERKQVLSERRQAISAAFKQMLSDMEAL